MTQNTKISSHHIRTTVLEDLVNFVFIGVEVAGDKISWATASPLHNILTNLLSKYKFCDNFSLTLIPDLQSGSTDQT
jgi:hypothetical protein